MIPTIFLQSAVQNPYELYETALEENPMHWDAVNNTWAVYSYEYCKALLCHPSAHIPSSSLSKADGINEYALLITREMARLTNGIHHEVAKQVVLFLFDNMKTVGAADIIGNLITKENENKNGEMDWVNAICKKLPVMVIAESFDFTEEDAQFISDNIEGLTKIMSPGKSAGQIAAINKIAREIYIFVENHLAAINFYKFVQQSLPEKYAAWRDNLVPLCACNLVGLFIQCYDAGRGLLSNSLLQLITNNNLIPKNFTNCAYLAKCITETLRFDPPVHNTKRVAANDILIKTTSVGKGDAILIVLAAANRDPGKFNEPGIFNMERPNNKEHLTFGIGGHHCPANFLSVSLASEALYYLFGRYKTIHLVEKDIHYEPLINVRLPKNIFISLA